MKTKKAVKADLEKRRPFFIEIGLIISLALVFLGFEWKQYDVSVNNFEPPEGKKIEENIVVNTKREKPKPEKKKPESQELEIVDDDVEIDEEIHIDAEAGEDTKIEDYEPVEVPDPEDEEEDVFIVVEEEPSFPGGDRARKEFIRKNLDYPEMARKSGIEGKVYVTFIVEPDGSITNVRVKRGVGAGCDKEAVRVVRNMPEWNPGKQRGKKVRVQFNMPIRFKLAG